MTTNPEPPTDHQPSTRDEPSGPIILYAEDDSIQRTALTRVLENAGFVVIAAETGAGAIALAEQNRPDLVLLDAVMPHLGGFEAIAAIRSRPELATTPTIVISGLEDVDSRVQALAIGADDFIIKPVNGAELVARVRAQLRTTDAWLGRVDAMIGSFRSIRRHIGATARVTDPSLAPEALISRFPRELGCSTLVTIERDGPRCWGADSPLPEDLAVIERERPAATAAPIVVPVNDRRACPLCGRTTDGKVMVASAGAWEGGHALLVAGCADRFDHGLAAVMGEVADACDFVLRERMGDWQANLERVRWLEGLIDAQAFTMVYQPIVDLQSGRIVAHEALARFDDGTSPVEALRMADALGRREELELLLLEVALKQADALHEGLRLHVNIAPSTALHPELADLVIDSRRRIVLEITEHALFSSANASSLRGSIPASCLLAADDVGAGYAGLAQLLDYRPDIVKIDRGVVAGIDHDPAGQALVAGLVQFAQATRGFVIAEGVERAEEWVTVRELGVDFGQGYHFARPMKLARAAELSYCGPAAATHGKRQSLRHLIAR